MQWACSPSARIGPSVLRIPSKGSFCIANVGISRQNATIFATPKSPLLDERALQSDRIYSLKAASVREPRRAFARRQGSEFNNLPAANRGLAAAAAQRSSEGAVLTPATAPRKRHPSPTRGVGGIVFRNPPSRAPPPPPARPPPPHRGAAGPYAPPPGRRRSAPRRGFDPDSAQPTRAATTLPSNGAAASSRRPPSTDWRNGSASDSSPEGGRIARRVTGDHATVRG